MVLEGFSSLEGRVSTPTHSPGPGTSFLRFLEFLKILIFLNRKFYRGYFENVSTFWLKPRYAVIIGNPIEIYSKPEICKYGKLTHKKKISTVKL